MGRRLAMRHPMVHNLKCWPVYFNALAEGHKTFDIREIRDREFWAGDTLFQEEWDPTTYEYTGRTLLFRVTYTLTVQPFVPEGFVAMGIRRLT